MGYLQTGLKNQWQGHIDEVLDIEENVCCPQLGLKGKIDATVQVTIHDRKGTHSVFILTLLYNTKLSSDGTVVGTKCLSASGTVLYFAFSVPCYAKVLLKNYFLKSTQK